MSLPYKLTRHTLPTDLKKTTSDSAKSLISLPATWALENPAATKTLALTYVAPLAGATLSKPLVSLLPLGAFSPLLGTLVTAFARFRLRQSCAGSYYALLHTAGLAGLMGQVGCVMGFMSLGAVFGLAGAAVQSWFTSLVLSTSGYQAPLVGLVLSLFASSTGWHPTGGGGGGTSMLANDLRSYAIFKGIGWSLGMIEASWKFLLEMAWKMDMQKLTGKVNGVNNEESRRQKMESWKRRLLHMVRRKVGCGTPKDQRMP